MILSFKLWCENLDAMQKAKKSGKPVIMPPLKNGVVVVILPGGGNRNFANQEYAQNFVDKFKG